MYSTVLNLFYILFCIRSEMVVSKDAETCRLSPSVRNTVPIRVKLTLVCLSHMRLHKEPHVEKNLFVNIYI